MTVSTTQNCILSLFINVVCFPLHSGWNSTAKKRVKQAGKSFQLCSMKLLFFGHSGLKFLNSACLQHLSRLHVYPVLQEVQSRGNQGNLEVVHGANMVKQRNMLNSPSVWITYIYVFLKGETICAHNSWKVYQSRNRISACNWRWYRHMEIISTYRLVRLCSHAGEFQTHMYFGSALAGNSRFFFLYLQG